MRRQFDKIILGLSAATLMGCSGAQAPKDIDAVTPAVTAAETRLYDAIAPGITEHMASPSILVFSKTMDWRHNEGIAGADLFFVQLAREQGYGIFTTENSAVFNEKDLSRFEVVIFNNMTGDSLSPAQETVFQNWLEKGGSWIGIHGSGDNSHKDWSWYSDKIIGPTFIGHPADPQFQDASVVTLAPSHPVMQGIPASWQHNDEWYSFDSRAQDHGMIPLAGLDEDSYSPRNDVYGDVSDLRMGKGAINHPIIWVTCPGKGRAVYSAIGHGDDSYDSEINRKFLNNSFAWVTRKTDAKSLGCKAE